MPALDAGVTDGEKKLHAAWRNFKDANIANLKGGKVSYYGNWDVMPCGLNAVELVLKSPPFQ